MTEPILNLASIQTITQEIVFEHFGFHEMHAAPAPELAMHAFAHANPDDPVAQSLSGVVIDAGYSFTHAVPIFDGRAIKDATRRIRVGGRLLTNLMKEWVRLQPCVPQAIFRNSHQNGTEVACKASAKPSCTFGEACSCGTS